MSLKIIISPAKKMNIDTDSLPCKGLPPFLPKTKKLLAQLKKLNYAQAKNLWKCNDKIATQQFENLQTISLEHRLTPAILAYEGIQYKYMAPEVFTAQEFAYVQKHLRIVSGFYGLLHPFDGVAPYRLEMQAKLCGKGYSSLYEFWGDALAKHLNEESKIIVNLASREYSKAIQPYLSPETTFVTCLFGELVDGKVIEKGTMCKMARGEMVRFMAEENIQTLAGIKAFNRSGYQYSTDYSTENTYTFIKGE